MKSRYHWLLSLYPQVWRDRYGEEYLALLEAYHLSPWLIWDVCLGAFDARLHLDLAARRFLRQTQSWVGLILQGIMVNVLVYGSAGKPVYWQAEIFFGVCFAFSLPILFSYAEHPALLQRWLPVGLRAEHATSQRIIGSGLWVCYAALYVVCGLDHRFNWSHVPVSVVVVADLLVAGGLILYFLVLRTHAIGAATAIDDTGQPVMSSRLYALVHHPLYTGFLALFLAIPLALGSWWGLLLFPPMLVLIMWRLVNEEKYLSNNLPGYRDYCAKVAHRLIPALW